MELPATPVLTILIIDNWFPKRVFAWRRLRQIESYLTMPPATVEAWRSFKSVRWLTMWKALDKSEWLVLSAPLLLLSSKAWNHVGD